ncbi:MAG: glycosyltransferase family 39 protein [Chloroflexi bacterium]|nr:glycosyltransferase family 39 protein [Chloroflexota bacterium]
MIIRHHLGLIFALIIALTLKAVLLAFDVFPFNADEAVVALMARHILQGARPVFFYGQSYLGSLDAWLIAFAFLIFGQTVLAIRIVQTVLYLGTILTTYLLGLKIFDKWVAASAALLLAIPTVLTTLYTTATLGGYGEVLLIGNILLLWTLRLAPQTSEVAQTAKTSEVLRARPFGFGSEFVEWFLFGLLAGVGFWGFGFLGIYFPPIAIAILYHYFKSRKTISFIPLVSLISFAFLGFAIGSFPWWQATLFGAETLSELGGSHLPEMTFGALSGPALRFVNLIILGFPVIIGMRPPWSVKWLALPLAPLAMIVILGAMVWAVKTSRRDWRRAMLVGVSLTMMIAFVITQFGLDPSGRYFLPLATPLALFTADLLKRVAQEYRRAALGLLGVLLIFNLWGNVESAASPPFVTTQFDPIAQVDQRAMPQLIQFLNEQGETRGYTNYWVEFPLAFLSREELIYESRLPYHEDFRHTPRDNRYVPYSLAVADSARAAYITTKHPALNGRIRDGLNRLGVKYSEKQIGDYTIFYALSRKVEPQELGL